MTNARRRNVELALVVVSGVLLGGMTQRAAASPHSSGLRYDACPTPRTLVVRPVLMEQVISAVHARVPHVFPHINDYQGRRVPTTPGSALLLEALVLNTTTTQARTLRRAAARFCGSTVADYSWVVIMTFPGAAMASIAQRAVFLAKTKSGWSMYGSIESKI